MDARKVVSRSRCSALIVPVAIFVTAVSAAGGAKERAVENRILVGGGVGFGFTTHTAECWTQNGQLVAFQTPDSDSEEFPHEPQHPEVTGMLRNGAWYFDLHSPDDRYFHSDNASGVVPKQEPRSWWSVSLHGIRLNEWYTARVVQAEVSGVVTCSHMKVWPG